MSGVYCRYVGAAERPATQTSSVGAFKDSAGASKMGIRIIRYYSGAYRIDSPGRYRGTQNCRVLAVSAVKHSTERTGVDTVMLHVTTANVNTVIREFPVSRTLYCEHAVTHQRQRKDIIKCNCPLGQPI